MANIILGFPNRVDSAVLAGGAWVEALPLANLQDRALARVARTLDIELTSTMLTVDLQQQRTLRVLAFVAHNFSLSARITLVFSNAADFSDPLLTVTSDAWPSVSDGEWDLDALEWENDNFWLGTYLQEDIEGQTPTCSILLPEDVLARYIKVTIDDSSNSAGFLQVGRLFIGAAFLQPRLNYSFGATLGYEDATNIDMALSGAEYFDRREPVRVMRFTLGYLSADEGFGAALELTRRAGVSGEVFVIPDPADTAYGATRSFLGRLRQLSPLEQLAMMSNGGLLNSMAFEIKELR